jgi:hypothetical protein
MSRLKVNYCAISIPVGGSTTPSNYIDGPEICRSLPLGKKTLRWN